MNGHSGKLETMMDTMKPVVDDREVDSGFAAWVSASVADQPGDDGSDGTIRQLIHHPP